MAEVLEHVDTTVLEQLEFEPACSVWIARAVPTLFGMVIPRPPQTRCPHVAVASIQCVVCGHDGLICRVHLDAMVAAVDIACTGCGEHGPVGEMFSVIPLGGTS